MKTVKMLVLILVLLLGMIFANVQNTQAQGDGEEPRFSRPFMCFDQNYPHNRPLVGRGVTNTVALIPNQESVEVTDFWLLVRTDVAYVYVQGPIESEQNVVILLKACFYSVYVQVSFEQLSALPEMRYVLLVQEGRRGLEQLSFREEDRTWHRFMGKINTTIRKDPAFP